MLSAVATKNKKINTTYLKLKKALLVCPQIFILKSVHSIFSNALSNLTKRKCTYFNIPSKYFLVSGNCLQNPHRYFWTWFRFCIQYRENLWLFFIIKKTIHQQRPNLCAKSLGPFTANILEKKPFQMSNWVKNECEVLCEGKIDQAKMNRPTFGRWPMAVNSSVFQRTRPGLPLIQLCPRWILPSGPTPGPDLWVVPSRPSRLKQSHDESREFCYVQPVHN